MSQNSNLIRKKRREERVWTKRYNMFEKKLKNSLLTRKIDSDVISLINNKAKNLRCKLGTLKSIQKVIDNTFPLYQYNMSPEDSNKVGICVGLFNFTPVYFSQSSLASMGAVNSNYINNNDYLGYEVGYVNDNGIDYPVFSVEPEFVKDVHKQYGNDIDYFVFNPTSVPKYWFTNDFFNMPERVYIFICTTHDYIPALGIDPLHNQHMWLTTAYQSRNKKKSIITNIFDTNSSNVYNIQYARMIEFSLSRENINLPLVDVNETKGIYFLDCQNSQYSDANMNTEPCIGLQNREIWGLCQTFILTMYTYVLENPLISKEIFDEVIREPEFASIMYSLGGIVSSGERIINTLKYDPMDLENMIVTEDIGKYIFEPDYMEEDEENINPNITMTELTKRLDKRTVKSNPKKRKRKNKMGRILNRRSRKRG